MTTKRQSFLLLPLLCGLVLLVALLSDKATKTTETRRVNEAEKIAVSPSSLSTAHRILQQVDSETLKRYHAAPSGYRRHPSYYSDKYLTRATPLPIGSATQKEMDATWGKWTLVDTARSTRPGDDFYAKYPNRDVPWDDLPAATAWQKDPVYLPKFLDEGIALAERAMEAILTEYGYGKDRDERPFEERIKILKDASIQVGDSYPGILRRVLHSIVTEDTFVLGMSGHSASAAHGNHFQQSYTHTYGALMEPIFARLGVHASSRNFGFGGLGTLQTGMATSALMGPDIDILMWDSGMTEKFSAPFDILFVQAILGGDRIPYYLPVANSKLLGRMNFYKNEIGADVGILQEDLNGINFSPKAVTVEDLEAQPWAAKCQNIDRELNTVCPRSYRGVCWINRTDFEYYGEDMSFTPTNTRQKEPGGRAGWHPGDRVHQRIGRAIAGLVLHGIRDALLLWKKSDNLVLRDEDWHVTEYYNSIRTNTTTAQKEKVSEFCRAAKLPERVCQVPLQARTEFTPRYDAVGHSIRNLFKVNASPMKVAPAAYDPPDVYNPNLHPPEGSLDVLQIVENGIDFMPNLGRTRRRDSLAPVDFDPPRFGSSVNPSILPGKGWYQGFMGGQDMCDGEYDSWCKRDNKNPCILYAHNDARDSLVFDSFSGWGIFELPDMREGLILIKYHNWFPANADPNTNGWKSENNEPTGTANGRRLKIQVAPTCDDFQFEFAIDGKINVWNKETWEKNLIEAQRVVQISTLLDDSTFTKGETKNVELAMRVTGCGREKSISLTHIYWA